MVSVEEGRRLISAAERSTESDGGDYVNSYESQVVHGAKRVSSLRIREHSLRAESPQFNQFHDIFYHSGIMRSKYGGVIDIPNL
jgi:hypothetical protein